MGGETRTPVLELVFFNDNFKHVAFQSVLSTPILTYFEGRATCLASSLAATVWKETGAVTCTGRTLTNARPNPVTVDLLQSGLWGDTRIAEESMPSQRRSADEALWRVPVPANGEATVTATFDTRF